MYKTLIKLLLSFPGLKNPSAMLLSFEKDKKAFEKTIAPGKFANFLFIIL